jgi:hypothetical protein
MRNHLLPVLFGVGLTLFGCGSKSTFDEALSGVKTYKDKMCACKDAACADQVDEDYDKFREGMKAKMKDSKPSEDQIKQLEDVESAMGKCHADAAIGGAK